MSIPVTNIWTKMRWSVGPKISKQATFDVHEQVWMALHQTVSVQVRVQLRVHVNNEIHQQMRVGAQPFFWKSSQGEVG